ncbi:hypothetical protein N7492_007235 [Penicillium capsulatum]|uniref:Uncharacterized protein n=1 Tax=Penicillium capsulatum TaxID=69766 RepID=A0A9W9HZG6_9EURO|nr:hypothetical protein N7492_007235 [Penicillium capsulatum]
MMRTRMSRQAGGGREVVVERDYGGNSTVSGLAPLPYYPARDGVAQTGIELVSMDLNDGPGRDMLFHGLVDTIPGLQVQLLHSYPISLDKIVSMTLMPIAADDATTHRLQKEWDSI